jgi:hypothetical protein
MEREIEKARKRFVAPPARLNKSDEAKPDDDVVRLNLAAGSTVDDESTR